MIKVFVTGLGGCGVGEGIAKALRMKNYEVYGSDVKPCFPSMKHISKSFLLPPATASDYIDTLINVCMNDKIKAVFPGSEIETKIIAMNVPRFTEAGIAPMINRSEIIETFQDAWKTYNILREHGFTVPESSLPDNLEGFVSEHKFPLIIKPIFGFGSKNVYIVHSLAEMDACMTVLKEKKIPLIIQKYVGSEDEEYTVGVFSDKKGHIISSIAMKRTMIAGATLNAQIEGYKEIESYCSRAAMALGSRGPLNFQLRKAGDKFFIFEINPRFSGTTPLRAMVGINEPDMMYRNSVLNESLPPVQYESNKIIMRMFEEVMIDKSELLQNESNI